MSAVRIAVVGAGLIGARHIDRIDGSPHAQLASVVDPAPAGVEFPLRSPPGTAEGQSQPFRWNITARITPDASISPRAYS